MSIRHPTSRSTTRVQQPRTRSPTERAPATFESTNSRRLPNLVDEDNGVLEVVAV